MKQVMILSDNIALLKVALLQKGRGSWPLTIACSESTGKDIEAFASECDLPRISVSRHVQTLIDTYEPIISLHCKQVFPGRLVRSVRCINFHPGYNPFNRGWFPHIFSMINGLPAGVTVHEMDEKIDHGPIIYQEKIQISDRDTSFDVYQRLIHREAALLEELLPTLIAGNYSVTSPSSEGNYNSKSDFDKLKSIDLDSTVTPRQFLGYLRAMSFAHLRNAYFVEEATQVKIYVRVVVDVESNESK